MAALIVIAVSSNPSQTGFLLQQARHEQIRKLIVLFSSHKPGGGSWLMWERSVPRELAIRSVAWEGGGSSKRKKDICSGRRTNGLPL